jgi:transposase-like protein
MTKHSGQEKIDVVHEYLEHNSALTSLSKKHQLVSDITEFKNSPILKLTDTNKIGPYF